MASKTRVVNAYLRNVIAPVVFPSGSIEKGNQIFGNCPDCGKGDEHCSITILDDNIVGCCLKCDWTIKVFLQKHPEYEELFSSYSKYCEENSSLFDAPEAEYYYTNSSGKILYRKRKYRKRNNKKTCVWQTLEADGKTYSNNLPIGRHAPIYRLHEISQPDKFPESYWLYVTEGEKDADALISLMKCPATCFPNGAVKRNTKIHQDWLLPFKGLRVIVIGDNDDPGITSADLLVKKLLPVASVVKKIMPWELLQMTPEEVSSKKSGYDVSDYIEEVGKEVAYQTIKRLSDEKPPETEDPKTSLPDWVIVKTSVRGNETRSINEPKFCDEFKKKYAISRINGVYYADGISVTDDYILQMIQMQIQDLFVEKTGQLVQQLNKTLENSSFASQPEPDERKIYCKGSISLLLDRSGNVIPYEEDVFTLTRLPVKYNPSATCPVFQAYLSDLFYEDDIPVIQEFIGYCLIPCTRAQAGLFIHGKGGEGKSVLRDVIMRLFGHAAIQESIHLFEERFIIANFENRLVCVDDDMQTELLTKTGKFKQLITAKGEMQVERKNKQKYNANLYTRVIGIGNSFLGSKFDHNDGFYRRQLLIDCKPKTRSAKDDDRFMSDKCTNEIEGILNWALVGLTRLIRNNYQFSVSERMKQITDETKKDNDNTLSFFEDDAYVKVTEEWHDITKSADLFAAYAYWCRDNNEAPIKRGSFNRRIAERYRRLRGKSEKVNAYYGIILSPQILKRVNDKYSQERAWLDRLQ